MLTPQQLKMRQSGLGGSDVSAALGLNPWKTQLQLWSEKCGKTAQPVQSAAMEWGSRLETPILRKFQDCHPELELSHAGGTVRHPEIPHLLATPDGFIVDEQGTSGILEVKTSGQQVWDEVPNYYLLQAQHYMYVLKREFAWFAVLFRGVEYREYGPFHLDREGYEEQVLPELQAFWDSVESENPVFQPISVADLSLKVDLREDAPPVKATLEDEQLASQYRIAMERAKSYKEEASELKLELAVRLQDSKKMVTAAGKTLVSQADVLDKHIPAHDRKGYRVVRVYG